MSKIIKRLPLQLILFIFFLGCLAIFINSNDTKNYSLQQMGIEAIVERGHFYVDGSTTPGLVPAGDVFSYKGHLYAVKQPGQFLLGSVVYYFLHKAGITYKTDLIFTGGLITLFTSVTMTAIMMVLFFNISFLMIKNRVYSFLVTCFFGFGTLLFPYSGVTHHDIHATFFTFLSFYLLFYKYHVSKSNSFLLISLSGFCAGLSLFFSYNSPAIIACLCLYSFSSRNRKSIILFILFLLIGLLPTFIFNNLVFGHPLNSSVSLSMETNTYYQQLIPNKLSLNNLIEKLNFYFISPVTSITFYSPITLVSLIGFFLLPNKYTVEKMILPLSLLLLFLQLSNVEAFSWTAYGPRYLMNSTPLILIGLAGFFTNNKNNFGKFLEKYKYTKLIVLSVGVVSIIICSIGSIIGTMYNMFSVNGFIHHLSNIISGDLPEFRFIPFGATCIIIAIVLFFIRKQSKLNNFIDKVNYFDYEYGRKWFYLTVILALGFLLRTINLNSIPLGLYADEASIGYNAYCISETGKDEYGEILPVYFKAFGEYKNPVLIYCAAFIIKLFGPYVFSLRLTSAILGLLTIFLTYKLTKLYFNKSIALLSALLLAISPWHIQYSRIAMDPIAFPPFFVLGFYLFSLGLKSKSRYIVLSAIPISISMYSYAIAKVFVPLFYFFFFLFNRKIILDKKQSVITCVILSILMLLPMYKATSEKNIQGRFNMISIFTSQELHEKTKEKLINMNLSSLSKNKYVQEAVIFFENYNKHMSVDFLLKNGDRNTRHNIGSRGQLLWFTFIMGIFGFLYLICKREPHLYIFPIWFLLFSIPSSLTWESIPHASRCICGIPVFEILASVGFFSIYSYIKNNIQNERSWLSIALSVALFIVSVRGVDDFKSYVRDYFTRYAKDSRYAFDYNLYAISKATENMKGFDNFLIPFDFPDVIFLYLQKINPKRWLTDKNVLKYVRDNSILSNDKQFARIVSPYEYPEEETINQVYDEITNSVIYEVKKIGNRTHSD